MDDDLKSQNIEFPGSNKSGAGWTINLAFGLTKSDLLSYNFHFMRLLMVGAAACFILAVAVFIYSQNIPPGDYRTTLNWVVTAFGVGFSLCGGPIAVVILQLFGSKNEAVNKAMAWRNYIISSSGIVVFNDQGRISRTWRDVKKVIKTRHGFYLKTGDKLAFVLPRHVFNGPEEIHLFERLSGLVDK